MITITEEEYNDIKEQINTNERLKETIKSLDELMKNDDVIAVLQELDEKSSIRYILMHS